MGIYCILSILNLYLEQSLIKSCECNTDFVIYSILNDKVLIGWLKQN